MRLRGGCAVEAVEVGFEAVGFEAVEIGFERIRAEREDSSYQRFGRTLALFQPRIRAGGVWLLGLLYDLHNQQKFTDVFG